MGSDLEQAMSLDLEKVMSLEKTPSMLYPYHLSYTWDHNGVVRPLLLPFLGGICYSDSDDNGESHDIGKENKEWIAPCDVKRPVEDGRSYQIWRKHARLRVVHSFGITSILVRGNKSMCVVTSDKSLDLEELQFRLDCVLVCHEGCFKKEGPEMKPFAAVNVFVGADNANEPSSVRKFGGLRKAIDFLHQKMKSDFAFSFEETVQTAISALKYLHRKDLRANEIEVRVIRDGTRKKQTLEAGEIEEHLLCIKEHCQQPSKLKSTQKIEGSSGGDKKKRKRKKNQNEKSLREVTMEQSSIRVNDQ